MKTSSDVNKINWVDLDFGKCIVSIDTERTRKFYASLPRISENCKCGYCKYFEEFVIKQPLRLFSCLEQMAVDLSRQPNINPDGVCSIESQTKGKIGYMGYYFVFGHFRESSHINLKQTKEKIEYMNEEFGTNVQLTILADSDEKLCFEFYLETENKENL